MNIALCLSGQPRSVEQAYPYIKKNVLDIVDPDVYVHAWVDDNIRGSKPLTAYGAISSDTIPENIEEVIEELYNPMECIYEEQIQFDGSKYYANKAPLTKPEFSLSQWYSVRECFKQVPMGRYDYLIRMRFDWGIKTPLNAFIATEFTEVICPNDCPHPGGFNDQFAIGPEQAMFTYSRLYDHIDEIYESGIRYCDEQLMGAHMRNGPHFYFVPKQIDYEIIRYAPDLHGRYEGEFYEES